MDIKVVQETLLMRDNLKELLINILKKDTKIDEERNKIRKKYIEDTNIKTKNPMLVDKNLIVYLMIKHGIDLSHPVDIGNFKINSRSKRLISCNGKSNYDIHTFINAMKTVNNAKYKLVIDDLEKYFLNYDESDDGSSLKYETIIDKKVWEIHVDHEFMIDDNEDEGQSIDDKDYEISVNLLDNKNNEIARFDANCRDDRADFRFELYSILKINNYNNDKFISIIESLHQGIYIKAVEVEKKIDEQIKLLNEFNLI